MSAVWRRRESTDPSDLGNPIRGDTAYRLCAWADGDPVYAGTVPAGTGWQRLERGGLRYHDSEGVADGIVRMRLSAGARATRHRVLGRDVVVASEAELSGGVGRLVFQISRSDAPSICWSSVFDRVRVGPGGLLRASLP